MIVVARAVVGRMWLGLVVLLAAVAPAGAAPGGLPLDAADNDPSEEWLRIRKVLFQDRPIFDVGGVIALEMPRRQAFGATVPIAIRPSMAQSPELYIRRLYLVVDKNPSPVGATWEFSPEVGMAELETRIRVQEYGHVRVVAELSDGQLHLASRYAKISGGCTQPPNKDLAQQAADLGKIRVRLADDIVANRLSPVQLQISHPNNTGFELNQITVMYIPSHFVSKVKVTYDGTTLLSADMDFSISEDPYLRFNFIPRKSGEIVVEVEDSHDLKFQKSFPVQVDPAPRS
jgi:sulfur-oxidizing protein SoxY